MTLCNYSFWKNLSRAPFYSFHCPHHHFLQLLLLVLLCGDFDRLTKFIFIVSLPVRNSSALGMALCSPEGADLLQTETTLQASEETEPEIPMRRSRGLRTMSLDMNVNVRLKSIYNQLGLLMAALINSPKDVSYAHSISSAIYHNMVLFLRYWSEIGCQVLWVQTRVTYVRDIMEAADACLRSKLPYETYIQSSRAHMDMCSRGGVTPPRPPSY